MSFLSRKSSKRRPSLKPLRNEAGKILHYWRDALLEGERVELNEKDVAAYGLETALADLKRGKCNSHCVRTLTEKESRRMQERSRNAPEKRSSNALRVLLFPLRFTKDNPGPGPRTVSAMCLPAQLLPSGELLPPPTGAPWIPRAHLDPIIVDDAVTVGSVTSLDRFAVKHPATPWQLWSDYWEYCDALCRAVTGARISSLKIDGYKRIDTAYLCLDPTAYGSTSALVRLLEEATEGWRHPGLIPHFANLKNPLLRDYPHSRSLLVRNAVRHCGQFTGNFPLARSQRTAVHCFMQTRPGDFLCVTGPPGTGKTTMLQSIIASLWIGAIGSKNAVPPVVVCCGATNQAVTNIIDSFQKSPSKDILSKRWLPSVRSHGTFCCSARLANAADRYQIEQRDGTGFSSMMEQPEYVQAAKTRFLEHFKSWSGKQSSLAKAVSHLHQEVLRERGLLYREILHEKDGSFSNWLLTLIGARKAIPASELFSALAKFDTTRRYHTFLLATHYWEGRWLLQMGARGSLISRSKQSSKPRLKNEAHDWQRRAMITPAFVSTLSMLPRFFASRNQLLEPPIDLLIYDEAGQIPVEAGTACSILAKKAVIVGDCEQLEPVWNVAPHIDRANAVKHRLIRRSDEKSWHALVKRGTVTSAGSFMYLALRSTRWTNRSTYGVFLSEHRRSVPEIVRFTNTLAYRNRLEPLRPELSSRVLPAFGYIHVPGISQQLGQSRYNRQEVDQIVGWLDHYEQAIKKFYSVESLAEVVAVITPFAAQTRRLEDRLKKRFPGMTIGTVNSLQGAERRIVLFSSVYDQAFEGTYFFDCGTNMLNVAVSRAQDTFIAVGNMQIFDPEAKKPSGVLARFLFSNPENELTEVLPAKLVETPAEETKRIATLEEHREVLFSAFQTARQQVLIASPTISSAAILHDKIPAFIREARSRNVRVLIYTDSYLDVNEGTLKEKAAEGRTLLKEAGAELYISKGIHNKAVAIDNHTLVEGSFNWLSAVRTAGSIHQKHEVSWCYRGPIAAKEITRLQDELVHRATLIAPTPFSSE